MRLQLAIFVGLVLCIPCLVDAGQRACQGGVISKEDSYFLRGQDVTLNCTVTDPGINSSELFFRRGIHDERVAAEYIQILSPNSIQMTIPNVTEKEVSDHRKGMKYKCYAVESASRHTCIASTFVFLEYYPEKVKDIRGLYLDLRQLHFTWSLGLEYKNHSHEVLVESRFGRLNTETDWSKLTPCHVQHATLCEVIGFRDLHHVQLQVRVTNTLLNVSATTTHTWDPFDLAKMAISGVALTDNASRCVQVVPKSKSTRSYTYNITYWSECDLGRVKYSDNLTICDLIPHANYTFTISQRLMENGRMRGYWSDPVTSLHQIPSAAPDLSPDETSLLFEYSGNKTLVYWKNLQPCDVHSSLDQLWYKVTVDGANVETKHDPLLQIPSPSDRAVVISITAGNDLGWAKQSTHLTLNPPASAPSPSRLIVQYNISKHCRQTFADIRPVADDRLFINITHKLVTCKGRRFCKKMAIDEIIPLKDGQQLYAFPSNHCYSDDTRYGVITEGRSQGEGHWISSGIHWVNCAYAIDKVPAVRLKVAPLQLDDRTVMVLWEPYNCLNQDTGYIETYLVSYCVDKGDNCQCDRIEHSVDRSQNRYTISDFDAQDKVCVWVRGRTAAGSGPDSLPEDIVVMIHDDTTNTLIIIGVVLFILCLGALVSWKVVVPRIKTCWIEKTSIKVPPLHQQQEHIPLQSYDDCSNLYETIAGDGDSVSDNIIAVSVPDLGPHGYRSMGEMGTAEEMANSTSTTSRDSGNQYSLVPQSDMDGSESQNRAGIQSSAFSGDFEYVVDSCLESYGIEECMRVDLPNMEDGKTGKYEKNSLSSFSDKLRVKMPEGYTVAIEQTGQSGMSDSCAESGHESSCPVNETGDSINAITTDQSSLNVNIPLSENRDFESMSTKQEITDMPMNMHLIQGNLKLPLDNGTERHSQEVSTATLDNKISDNGDYFMANTGDSSSAECEQEEGCLKENSIANLDGVNAMAMSDNYLLDQHITISSPDLETNIESQSQSDEETDRNIARNETQMNSNIYDQLNLPSLGDDHHIYERTDLHCSPNVAMIEDLQNFQEIDSNTDKPSSNYHCLGDSDSDSD